MSSAAPVKYCIHNDCNMSGLPDMYTRGHTMSACVSDLIMINSLIPAIRTNFVALFMRNILAGYR